MKKKSRQRAGEAMVVVICIMAVLMVLSLSMLLAASSATGSAKKSGIYDRCQIMAVSFSEMVEANVLGQEKTGALPAWPVEEECRSSEGESLAHLAMRSLRNAVQTGSSAIDGQGLLPVFENDTVGNEAAYSAEEIRQQRQQEETQAAVYQVENYSQEGYTIELKIYLDYNPQAVQAAYDQAAAHYEEYEAAALALQGNGRLILTVTCRRDQEAYQVRSYYQIYTEDNGERVQWRWEKERME